MAKMCKELHKWVEEEIEKPFEKWIEKRVKKCKKKKCKWWCGCCNKWFCWIETFLEKVVKWVVVTMGKWVARVVCEVVSFILDLLGKLILTALAFPIIGRLIRQVWTFLIDIVWRIVGIFGAIFDILGFDWEKKLRICLIILRDKNRPLTTSAMLDPTIQNAIQIYKDAANIKLIVEDIQTVTEPERWDRILDVNCDFGAWTDDIWLRGGDFELASNRYCLDGTGRRLIGWAAPVIVFLVRDVEGKLGCSLGTFSDYVTIEAKNPRCLAHEIAHACSFWLPPHHDDSSNLLHSICGGTKLRKWQKVLIRNSRHVTYL